jgi:hypothetical protein
MAHHEQHAGEMGRVEVCHEGCARHSLVLPLLAQMLLVTMLFAAQLLARLLVAM